MNMLFFVCHFFSIGLSKAEQTTDAKKIKRAKEKQENNVKMSIYAKKLLQL